MKYAIILNSVVHNIVLSDSATYISGYGDTILIEGLDPQPAIGWWYTNGTFTMPEITPTDSTQGPPNRYITKLAFLSRFTDQEAIGIDLASIGTTPQAAALRRYQNKVSAAKFIDLDRQDTREGVLALEGAGLLPAGRALEILDAPILDEERA